MANRDSHRPAFYNRDGDGAPLGPGYGASYAPLQPDSFYRHRLHFDHDCDYECRNNDGLGNCHFLGGDYRLGSLYGLSDVSFEILFRSVLGEQATS